MIREPGSARREVRAVTLEAELVIVGGGLAGTCAAITAARAGMKVILVQDRPVLGGNASSEVRLWVLGATSHMGNNNRWSREGGVIDELLIENTYRNPEGNALLFDAVLLDKIIAEPNITLLLNTAALDVEKRDDQTIAAVRAFCSQNSTAYTLRAPLFCDASGDGILGFVAGAAFRMGAESREEFGEKFAPDHAYGELLGHSIYFYSKDTGRPVEFVAPKFAMRNIPGAIPRYRDFNTKEYGCRLWWIEYGGRVDTVHETEAIKWELWKIVYGVWDYIKNSGNFPDARNLTLEWIGTIPGKRESRRFEGDYMLTQQDIVEQRRHDDAVSVGGWAIDLHPADGVLSDQSGCQQWHSKGVYQIPYRTMYSRNISNLFLAGRIISASHVAFGSTRVMATCAHNAQAVGMAAAVCKRHALRPRDLLAPSRMKELQLELLRSGQFIPNVAIEDGSDLSLTAEIKASSTLALQGFAPSGDFVPLERGRAMLLPLQAGEVPKVTLYLRSLTGVRSNVIVQLRTSSRKASFTPDEVLEAHAFEIGGGLCMSANGAGSAILAQSQGSAPESHGAAATAVDRDRRQRTETIVVPFSSIIETKRYAFVTILANPDVEIALSDDTVTGVVCVSNNVNKAVGKSAVQLPPADIGIDTFEMWLPDRRPNQKTLAMQFDPPIRGFDAENVRHDPQRPTDSANAWIASPDDPAPWLQMRWDHPQRIHQVTISFDTDFDHALESVLMGHADRVMPSCIRNCRLRDKNGHLIGEISGNYETRRTIEFQEPVHTALLRLEFEPPADRIPVSLFRILVR